ncbi:N-acetylmuramoyl-L-alanine amidase [Fodinicola acaciae]|uniref:N-acetylmuramoyl-L-alanine amidase n=1 Tax=Fodinicola acaciae TaxID=2681555 RepID=UPI0013D4F597|nr:N-acetylmuramoyl-L-alanine amidase [Fodinicola acaciae]
MRRFLGTVVLGLALLTPVPATAAPVDRQQDFAAAAEKYGVPVSVLLGVSYLESRWDDHRGSPSSAGGFGPMNLTDARYVVAHAPAGNEFADDPRGDERRPSGPLPDTGTPALDAPSMRTLPEAATLTGLDPAALRTDPAANIAGAAALLARYQHDLGFSGAEPGDWYGAVARYSGATTGTGARQFADQVFDLIRTGASRQTNDGQHVSLAGTDLRPATGQLAALRLASTTSTTTECPSTVDCDFAPAAYTQTGASKEQYGNYDWAHRPANLKIQYIVIHDQEGYYNGTVSWFQNPAAKTSSTYVMRSSDGHITQMVKTSDLAWHAGNWYLNMHSVGIEHEGFAAAGATWYTEAMYRQSAKLVRYLAQRFDIPLDRRHILAHGNVPALVPAKIPGMHWDPGPYWDWNHYMDLLHATPRPARFGGLLTISPDFATNQPPVTGCDKSGSGNPCPPQASNVVYLRESPSADAPLVTDTGLGAGAYDIADWGARAEAGQQFASAGRSGDWSAIWYLGRKAWFLDPRKAPTAYASAGFTVTPRHGLSSIQVFGAAYPEPAAYNGNPVPAQPVTPLPYAIAAGQRYALGEWRVPTDYYYAPTIDASYPGDHTVVRGKTRYLEIQFNHRVAFVKASDVTLLPY